MKNQKKNSPFDTNNLLGGSKWLNIEKNKGLRE